MKWYVITLLRMQKGCYIYCEDKQLAEYIKRRISNCNGITYAIGKNEENYELQVEENGEEYRYE